MMGAREEIAQYEEKWAQQFENWHDGFAPKPGNERCKWGKDYWNQIRKAGFWGGELEITSMCRLKKRQAIVFRSGEKPLKFGEPGRGKLFLLYYDAQARHYKDVKAANGGAATCPLNWGQRSTQAEAGLGMRGG